MAANLNANDLFEWNNQEGWNGWELHQWVEEAEEGDEWENSADKIIKTN